MISLNKLSYGIVKKLIENRDYYRVTVEKLPSGATIIDTGLEAHGGYEAGLIITRIAMGGAGTATLSYDSYDEFNLPTIIISTDHPAVSLFGAQLAGWRIKAGDYRADGSGPARALALRPKEVYEKIQYKDKADVAVILLETENKPPDEAAYYISDRCGVEPNNVYMVLTNTTSLAGMVQISGRIVETGLFRLDILGLDLKKVKYGAGYAPIMPVHPDSGKAMGRAEDALTYGGVTSYIIDESDEKLEEIANKAPSTNCKDYGKTSYEIYKAVDFDFTKVDPALFAPAAISITSAKTGTTFTRGKVNTKIIKNSSME